MLENLKLNLKEDYTSKIKSEFMKIVMGYISPKGYTVKVLKEDNWVYSSNVIISLNMVIYKLSNAELNYYLKVFLNQPVEMNLEWDIKMTKSLGNLYPRAVKNLVPM